MIRISDKGHNLYRKAKFREQSATASNIKKKKKKENISISPLKKFLDIKIQSTELHEEIQVPPNMIILAVKCISNL